MAGYKKSRGVTIVDVRDSQRRTIEAVSAVLRAGRISKNIRANREKHI